MSPGHFTAQPFHAPVTHLPLSGPKSMGKSLNAKACSWQKQLVPTNAVQRSFHYPCGYGQDDTAFAWRDASRVLPLRTSRDQKPPLLGSAQWGSVSTPLLCKRQTFTSGDYIYILLADGTAEITGGKGLWSYILYHIPPPLTRMDPGGGGFGRAGVDCGEKAGKCDIWREISRKNVIIHGLHG